jgi:effector-binding domain-containing protein
VYKPELIDLPATPAVVIHRTAEAARLTEVFDEGFENLYTRLAAAGVALTGAAFTRYLSVGDTFELELGVPTSASSSLPTIELPECQVARLRYVGPYEGLREACERLFDWIAEYGRRPSGPFWETYVTDPMTEPDPAKRITDIYVPLAG